MLIYTQVRKKCTRNSYLNITVHSDNKKLIRRWNREHELSLRRHIVHVILSIWSAVTDGFFIIREESRRQACDVFKTSRWASGGDFVIVWRDGRQIIWWRVVGWDDQKALHSGGSCEPRFGDRWTGGLPRPDSLSLGEVSHHVKVKTRIKWRI